jgi:hypothetical protein
MFPSGVTPQMLMANNQQQLQMMSSVQQLQMMNNTQQLQMMNGILPLNIAGLQIPFGNGTMPLLNITSKVPKKTKKRRKKPKDRPKRPLSAYNLFFKDERGNILSSIPGEGDDEDDSSPPRKNITWPGKKRPPHGKISFESLAKTIGGRWKALSGDRLTYYKKKAEEDLERYAKEMIAYEKKLTMKQELSKGKSSESSEEDEEEEQSIKTKDTKVVQTKRKRDPIRSTSPSDAADSDKNDETNNKKPKSGNQSPNNQDMNMSNGGMAGMGMGVYFFPTGDNQTNLNALGLMGNNALTNASEQSNENGTPNQRQFGQMMSAMNSDLQGYEQELMQQRRHLQHQQDLLSNFNDLDNENNNSNFSAHRDLQQDYAQAQMYNNHQQAFMNNNSSNNNNNEDNINGGEEYRMGMNQFSSEFNKD